MEPEIPDFNRNQQLRFPNPPELKDSQEIEELYHAMQAVSFKLFDNLLEEKKQWADAQSTAFKEQPKEMEAEESKGSGCKCSKIGCLKLYCECFSNGRKCTELCRCSCCKNKPGHENQILEAKMLANYRHPGTFKGIPAYVPVRKCTCKKSRCKKKYCQCYNAGLKCTEFCECKDCQNCDQHNDSSRYKFETPINESFMQIEVSA